MKARTFFYSREHNMRRMVSALIVYSIENPDKYDKIETFLIRNDFLVRRSINTIKAHLEKLLKTGFYDNESLCCVGNVYLHEHLNSFIQPLPFKDQLQYEKNKKLICFCKKMFNAGTFYFKHCGFTYKDYTRPIVFSYKN